ncbi:MAG: bifunctional folylpolyglutamate synthase/dihydrofolate synthase [Coriobacteriia bacterium]
MAALLDFTAAVAALGRALRFGIHPSLDGIRVLTTAMDRPEATFASAQVTGTNGKTSVTRLLAAVLRAHGLRTGVYTSPHLVSYTERIEIDGVRISEQDFARAVSTAVAAASASGDAEDLTEFEILTAAAFEAFRAARIDWACLEVGMGGRWDATSIVSPRVSVITGVALDHTDRLGATREAIAADKAYVIKPGTTAVLGPGCTGVEGVLLERAAAVGAPVLRVGLTNPDVSWTLLAPADRPGGITHLDVEGALGSYPGLGVRAPSYQVPNVAVALAAAEAALGTPLDLPAVREVLLEMTFPGRFQVLREAPALVIDGAHNPEAAGVLASAVRDAFGEVRPVFILGVMADKDAAGIVAALGAVGVGFVVTASQSGRALDPGSLAEIVRRAGHEVLATVPTVAEAIAVTEDLTDGPVVATGSIYVAGEIAVARGGLR